MQRASGFLCDRNCRMAQTACGEYPAADPTEMSACQRHVRADRLSGEEALEEAPSSRCKSGSTSEGGEQTPRDHGVLVVPLAMLGQWGLHNIQKMTRRSVVRPVAEMPKASSLPLSSRRRHKRSGRSRKSCRCPWLETPSMQQTRLFADLH